MSHNKKYHIVAYCKYHICRIKLKWHSENVFLSHNC